MHQGEKFNTLSHFLAALIVLPGSIYLYILAANTGDPWKITSVVIYCITLLLMYSTSSIYHGHSGQKKQMLQTMDFLSIYLLIAGTYTPFMLVTLRGTWGWSILAVVWGLAFIGMRIDIRSKNTEQNNSRLVQMTIYLVMGWMIVFALEPLTQHLASNAILLLALGGGLYTFGIIFYLLTDRVKHAHGIWHLFVIAGSVSHYATIAAYVI